MRIRFLPVNDHRVRRSLISVATTFLLAAPTRERESKPNLKNYWDSW